MNVLGVNLLSVTFPDLPATSAGKFIYFDTEDPVTTDLLVSDWSFLISFFDIEGDSDVLHLFGYGIGPKEVVIFFDECVGLRDIAWHTDSKLVRLLDHASLDCGNDSISLLEGVICPPCMGGFFIYCSSD